MLAPISPGPTRARSSFKRLAQYLQIGVDKKTGEEIVRGDLICSHAIISPETAITEMRATASRNTRVKDPVWHHQISWRQGEKPGKDQWVSAAKHSISALGLAEHQYIVVAHGDTDNFHVHVMANRVHPQTYKAHYPEFAKRALDKAMREMEASQGWAEDPGLFRWDPKAKIAVQLTRDEMRQRRESRSIERGANKAGKLEQFSDTESLETYCKGAPAKALRAVLDAPDPTWQKVHQILHAHGLKIVAGEKGGYTVRPLENDTLHVRASRVFRSTFAGKSERADTEAKLGEFCAHESESIASAPPADVYRPRPTKRDPKTREDARLARALEREQLRSRYEGELELAHWQMGERKSEGRELLNALKDRQKDEVRVAKRQSQKRTSTRAARGAIDATAVAKLETILASLPASPRVLGLRSLSERHRVERAQLQKAERAAISALLPLRYRPWIAQLAASGDPAAIAQHRGFTYQARRQGSGLDQSTAPQLTKGELDRFVRRKNRIEQLPSARTERPSSTRRPGDFQQRLESWSAHKRNQGQRPSIRLSDEDAAAEFKRRLLAQEYSNPGLAARLKARGIELTWVNTNDPNATVVRLGSGWVADLGPELKSSGGDPEVMLMVELARAKGWTNVDLTGDVDFCERAVEALRAEGITVKSVNGRPPIDVKLTMEPRLG